MRNPTSLTHRVQGYPGGGCKGAAPLCPPEAWLVGNHGKPHVSERGPVWHAPLTSSWAAGASREQRLVRDAHGETSPHCLVAVVQSKRETRGHGTTDGEWIRHGVVLIENVAQSAHASRMCATSCEKSLDCQVGKPPRWTRSARSRGSRCLVPAGGPLFKVHGRRVAANPWLLEIGRNSFGAGTHCLSGLDLEAARKSLDCQVARLVRDRAGRLSAARFYRARQSPSLLCDHCSSVFPSSEALKQQAGVGATQREQVEVTGRRRRSLRSVEDLSAAGGAAAARLAGASALPGA